MDSKLNNLRHSTAHLLASAILDLYPGTLHAIGPAIENGFYYDFDFMQPISDTDLIAIEIKMSEILKTWNSFTQREVSEKEAKTIFKNNPYKLELIDEIITRKEKITLYKSGDFEDLCRGGHVSNPSSEIKAFKLLSIAGAYWRGNEKNKMLTRVYGTSFPTQRELEDHLSLLEEAKKRDHKKLGKDLDLFVFSESVGKGLPLWTPKGSVIRRILERFIVDEELKRGYLHVYTPDIANITLYEKSGHYPYYKESMYAPIAIDDEKYMLRPMTCPHHFELYLSQQRSYRELPLRYAELAKLYRYEQSGELSGLQRVRAFTLADAHIIARKNQAEEELNSVLDLIEYITQSLGLKYKKGSEKGDFYYRLSLGNRQNDKKYYKNDSEWDYAEKLLKKVLTDRKTEFIEKPDEAAFYGPKIDIQMFNANGKEDTAFTVQYDFAMPQRFNLSYINEEGSDEQPVVIHRSSIGAIERIMAFLIEHYAGAFPLWLAPIQVILLPIADRHNEFTKSINDLLLEKNIRSQIDTRPERLQAKIRDATLQKVPFMGIIGDKEVANKTISVRARTEGDQGQINLPEFLRKLKEDIDKKR
jgi:threonyl-tRNA synthetase